METPIRELQVEPAKRENTIGYYEHDSGNKEICNEKIETESPSELAESKEIEVPLKTGRRKKKCFHILKPVALVVFFGFIAIAIIAPIIVLYKESAAHTEQLRRLVQDFETYKLRPVEIRADELEKGFKNLTAEIRNLKIELSRTKEELSRQLFDQNQEFSANISQVYNRIDQIMAITNASLGQLETGFNLRQNQLQVKLEQLETSLLSSHEEFRANFNETNKKITIIQGILNETIATNDKLEEELNQINTTVTEDRIQFLTHVGALNNALELQAIQNVQALEAVHANLSQSLTEIESGLSSKIDDTNVQVRALNTSFGIRTHELSEGIELNHMTIDTLQRTAANNYTQLSTTVDGLNTSLELQAIENIQALEAVHANLSQALTEIESGLIAKIDDTKLQIRALNDSFLTKTLELSEGIELNHMTIDTLQRTAANNYTQLSTTVASHYEMHQDNLSNLRNTLSSEIDQVSADVLQNEQLLTGTVLPEIDQLDSQQRSTENGLQETRQEVGVVRDTVVRLQSGQNFQDQRINKLEEDVQILKSSGSQPKASLSYIIILALIVITLTYTSFG